MKNSVECFMKRMEGMKKSSKFAQRGLWEQKMTKTMVTDMF